jgi:hypothetical protein
VFDGGWCLGCGGDGVVLSFLGWGGLVVLCCFFVVGFGLSVG